MVFERVSQMLGENTDENTTFEPPKEPVNKGKTPAFADVNPIWLALLNDFRTFDWRKALPDPEVAIKQMNQSLALV